MADYYPILTRAIAGLDANTGEARRGVYDRARTALVTQLRGFDPPLAEADIKRERLALEESIRRVEAENRELEGEVREAFRAAPEPQAPRQPAATPGGRAAPTPPSRGTQAPPPPVQPRADFSAAREEPAGDYDEGDAGDDRKARRERRRAAKRQAAEQISFPPGSDEEDDQERPSRRNKLPLIIGAVAVLVLLLGVGGFFALRGMLFGAGAPEQTAADTGDHPGKIADRVQQGPADASGAQTTGPTAGSEPSVASAPAAQPAAPATPSAAQPSPPPAANTQRAILYEENGDPQGGATFEGTVTWRVESSSPGQGQPPETALRGDINIPDRFTAVVLVRRNTDNTLPASHTIEIQFNLPPNFPNAGIANVPGLIMKTDEQAQGAALAGLSVRVTGGVFLIGLSNLESERGANEALLRERTWIDIPILYDNGRRAVLTLEKGPTGTKAFSDAIAAWHSASDASAAPSSGGSSSTTTPQ